MMNVRKLIAAISCLFLVACSDDKDGCNPNLRVEATGSVERPVTARADGTVLMKKSAPVISGEEVYKYIEISTGKVIYSDNGKDDWDSSDSIFNFNSNTLTSDEDTISFSKDEVATRSKGKTTYKLNEAQLRKAMAAEDEEGFKYCGADIAEARFSYDYDDTTILLHTNASMKFQISNEALQFLKSNNDVDMSWGE